MRTDRRDVANSRFSQFRELAENELDSSRSIRISFFFQFFRSHIMSRFFMHNLPHYPYRV
jgi:hypothetical protein